MQQIAIIVFIFIIILLYAMAQSQPVRGSAEGSRRKVGFESKRNERLFDKDTGEILGDRRAKT